MTDGVQFNSNVDLTSEIQLLLKCTSVLEGRFGLVAVICFICGKKHDKLYDRHLSHSLYGNGKNLQTEAFWKALGT